MEEIVRKRVHNNQFFTIHLATMGGSKGGKHSKGKGKSKLMKNETSSTTREALNSKLDLAQTSNDKAQGLGDSKEKSPDPRIKASSRYTGSIEDGSSGTSAPSSTILRAIAQREIGADWALIEGTNLVHSHILKFLDEEFVKKWQESSPNDLRTAVIVELMKSIKDLDEKVKVEKEWAQKKVVDSAKRLSNDLLELKMLKLEKVETQRQQDEKLCAENSCMLRLKETEQSLRDVNCEASMISESIKTLEVFKAHIKADIEALRLSASEYGNKLNQVINREMRCMKKLGTIGKQTSNLRANCDEEKQKVSQLELDVFQGEKEAKETEEKWKQEIKEKEQMVALLAEETRKARPHKANLRAELLKIRQNIEIERNLKMDEVKSLETELSCLRMFYQLSNVSLEGDTFLYNGIEVASLESSAPYEHWNCMICSTNEVSVVFLPCTHQVLCARCYEGSCSTSMSGQHCPYCGAEIQQIIKAYAPS